MNVAPKCCLETTVTELKKKTGFKGVAKFFGGTDDGKLETGNYNEMCLEQGSAFFDTVVKNGGRSSGYDLIKTLLKNNKPMMQDYVNNNSSGKGSRATTTSKWIREMGDTTSRNKKTKEITEV